MARGRLAGGALILALAAGLALVWAAKTRVLPDRYNPLEPLDPSEALNPVTDAKLWLADRDGPLCRAALARATAFRLMPGRADPPGCSRDHTVTISGLSEAKLRPEEMNCTIALRLYLLERHVIQPAARRHFNSGVATIAHFGSYSCRTIAGSWRMSEHATANAIDLAGFRLGNGRLISLKKDWNGAADARDFLREVREGACRLFNTTLSPDYNNDHADHFHLDMGLFHTCR